VTAPVRFDDPYAGPSASPPQLLLRIPDNRTGGAPCLHHTGADSTAPASCAWVHGTGVALRAYARGCAAAAASDLPTVRARKDRPALPVARAPGDSPGPGTAGERRRLRLPRVRGEGVPPISRLRHSRQTRLRAPAMPDLRLRAARRVLMQGTTVPLLLGQEGCGHRRASGGPCAPRGNLSAVGAFFSLGGTAVHRHRPAVALRPAAGLPAHCLRLAAPQGATRRHHRRPLRCGHVRAALRRCPQHQSAFSRADPGWAVHTGCV